MIAASTSSRRPLDRSDRPPSDGSGIASLAAGHTDSERSNLGTAGMRRRQVPSTQVSIDKTTREASDEDAGRAVGIRTERSEGGHPPRPTSSRHMGALRAVLPAARRRGPRRYRGTDLGRDRWRARLLHRSRPSDRPCRSGGVRPARDSGGFPDGAPATVRGIQAPKEMARSFFAASKPVASICHGLGCWSRRTSFADGH